MARVVTFGEIMLRLSPPGRRRLVQADSFEATYGGAEANVAISLAGFGVEAHFVTLLPEGPLGEGCLRYLRSMGVDTSPVLRRPGRLGIYFLEKGAMRRPGRVIYDRRGSCIAEAGPGDLDWQRILKGAEWLHWSGITPALSRGAARLCAEAVETARGMGLTVSCDLNYRSKLWRGGRDPLEVIPPLVERSHLLIGGLWQARRMLDDSLPAEGPDADHGWARRLFEAHGGLERVAWTLRGDPGGPRSTWSGLLFDGSELHRSRTYELGGVVDRVGAGDAFAAGLIHSLLGGAGEGPALEFAVAAGYLKHSIPGDANLVSAREVERFLEAEGGPRIER